MDWNNFVPTREIREYDMKLRESVRQREQMKLELAELAEPRAEVKTCSMMLNTKCWKRV